MNKNISPIVSIIVPCYNQAHFLDECLESVFIQKFKYWECIIVNDGSPDKTEEIAKEWCNRDSRFVYLEKTNGGLADARNKGIEISKGSYILPLDADDKLSNNYIEKSLIAIEKSEQVKVVYGKAIKFGVINEIWNLPKYSFNKLKTRNLIYCSGLYRKSDWELNGKYDVRMVGGLEDWEFWLNLLKRGGYALKLDDICFYYRTTEESMAKNLYRNQQQLNDLENYIFNKHMEIYGNKSAIYYFSESNKLKDLEKHITFRELILIFLRKMRNISIRILKPISEI
ncbi:MAG: glycosyltransferase family 2 protein [Cyclobacteriaceae bacterium]